jgi:hypothetical protein
VHAVSAELRYARHRPEATTLYNVVRENLDTLYGAVDDGALSIALPDFVRAELESYLDCGLLCRGFARLACEACGESRLVAFSCKGRGFCPSCLGRRMCSTAADLVEHVLPPSPLRQWVLTFPFAWRKRLGYDAPLLGALTRLFVQTVHGFYAQRMEEDGAAAGQSGAVIVVQRTASDLKLNPHLHVVFLDGVFREQGEHLTFHALSHLQTREVADVLERACKRIAKWLRRRGMLLEDGEDDGGGDDDAHRGVRELAASAASGQSPPAGPEWRRGALPLVRAELRFDKPLCASKDGFTLHAATRAGALDAEGREALLKYVLRPPIAQERVTHGPDGLVRITLKRPFADGTVAVDMDPLSLLCRLAASVPAPRFNTVRYAGVLAANAKLRPRIVPQPTVQKDASAPAPERDVDKRGASRYRPWAELLKRTFGVDVLQCETCHARMKLLAMVTDEKSIARFLRKLGEPTDPPRRLPARGPPYWKSRVLRRLANDAA